MMGEAGQHPRHTEHRPDQLAGEHQVGRAAEQQQAGMPSHQMAEQQMSHEMMMSMQPDKLRWPDLVTLTLGVWLITSPFTIGYQSVWLIWSDIISGALVMLFSLLALWPRRPWAPWAVCFIGLWVMFAPVLFFAPTPAAYLNDTLVGAWLIALTVLIPMMPGMRMLPGPEIPPGWSYNPSAWLQRIPIIALGLVGFFLARYMTAFQLGHIDWAWDPFFGDGTVRILTSDVSRAFPISDAGLGAYAYAIEALMGFMGGKQRWRTMPWMVTLFGILVVPLGLVSITLVILQPVAVGAWCTPCLVAALAMLIMIPLTLDEVVAMIQFMVQTHREGKPLWETFWKGGTIEGGAMDERTPAFGAPASALTQAMVWGVNLPWTLLLSAGLGLWLMAVPAITGTTGPAADSNHLAGAVVVTIAAVALAEVGRTARFLNILLGLWIIVAPWLLTGSPILATWLNVATGVLLIGLSLPRGPVGERYAGWNRYIQ